MADRLRARADAESPRTTVAGPAPAYIARRADRWRYNVVLRGAGSGRASWASRRGRPGRSTSTPSRSCSRPSWQDRPEADLAAMDGAERRREAVGPDGSCASGRFGGQSDHRTTVRQARGQGGTHDRRRPRGPTSRRRATATRRSSGPARPATADPSPEVGRSDRPRVARPAPDDDRERRRRRPRRSSARSRPRPPSSPPSPARRPDRSPPEPPS